MDLTTAATPAFFVTMGAERRWLRRRGLREGPSAADYERADTRASLTMGVLSLVVPIASGAVMRRLAPQRTLVGRVVAVGAVTAIGVTAVADRVRNRSTSVRIRARAAAVARVSGPTAVAATAVAVSAAWNDATTPSRLFARRLLPDRGSGPLVTAAAIAGWDFVYYWNHRAMHECRYLWAYHVVHHSSQRYNLSTALRQPVADSLGVFLPYGALGLLGVRPPVIETARGVNLLYQYWIHTDTIGTLGPAEEVFNTASHHRVHHGMNRRYIDRNHGSILIAWDRLFGTFQREDEPVRYGLTKNVDSYDPRRIATHEYRDILRDVRDATGWRDRASFMLRGPGWAYARHAAATSHQNPRSTRSARSSPAHPVSGRPKTNGVPMQLPASPLDPA